MITENFVWACSGLISFDFFLKNPPPLYILLSHATMLWISSNGVYGVHYHLIYFVTSFLFEPLCFGMFFGTLLLKSHRNHGKNILIQSRFFTLEYLIYYIVIYYSMGPSLTSIQTQLQQICYQKEFRGELQERGTSFGGKCNKVEE